MAQPLADFSASISTSSAVFPATPNYSISVPEGKELLVEEVSFSPDGNFVAQGRLQLYMRNQMVTTGGGAMAAGGIPILSAFTLNFKKDNVMVLLGTGERIDVFIASADGSTTVTGQVLVSGYLLSKQEADELRETYKGKIIIGENARI